MADWTELPFELLYEIVMRLETIEDFVYFSIVCRWWNYIASMAKNKFTAKTIMPWLLLAENVKENSDYVRKVLNPFNNKYYQLKLEETFGCRCWGSMNGWLVTYNHDMELNLYNPLTKVRMPLPSITSLPYKWGPHVSICTPDTFLPGVPERMMRSQFIQKAFVFELSQDDFIVFVSYYLQFKKLAFARPGDQSWTFVEEPVLLGVKNSDHPIHENASGHVADVVYDGARILILYEDASIGYLDICGLSDPRKLVVNNHRPNHYSMILSDSGNLGMKAIEYLPAPQGMLEGFSLVKLGLYLVESNGDIFMVLRDTLEFDIGKRDFDYKTREFIVYKYDFDIKWSRVHHLGDFALCVGNNISMAVQGIAASNCNRIYYTDDLSDYWSISLSSPGKDMGVFDLENGKLEDIYDDCDRYSRLQPPLWFMPRF